MIWIQYSSRFIGKLWIVGWMLVSSGWISELQAAEIQPSLAEITSVAAPLSSTANSSYPPSYHLLEPSQDNSVVVYNSVAWSLPLSHLIKSAWVSHAVWFSAVLSSVAYLIRPIYTLRLSGVARDYATRLLMHQHNPADTEWERLMQNHPDIIANDTLGAPSPENNHNQDPLPLPPWWRHNQDSGEAELSTATESQPSSRRDTFIQAKLRLKIKSLEAAYQLLSDQWLSSMLGKSSTLQLYGSISAADFLAAFEQQFAPQHPVVAADQTRYMQLKYLMLSKYVFHEHPHLHDYLAPAVANLATLQDYERILKDFFNSYQTNIAQSSSDQEQKHADSEINTLISLYHKMTPEIYLSRLQQHLSVDLHHIPANQLLNYVQTTYTPLGVKVFLLVFMNLSASDYPATLEGFVSNNATIKRDLMALTAEEIQGSQMRAIYALAKTQWENLHLDNARVRAIAEHFHIHESQQQEFLTIITNLAAEYLTQPLKLIHYYLFFIKIFNVDQHLTTHWPELRIKTTLMSDDRSKKLSQVLDTRLHFELAHLQKRFDYFSQLQQYQKLALNKYVTDEINYISSDYRWQYGSYIHLKKRLDNFIEDFDMTGDGLRISLLHASLGIPVMEQADLVELLSSHFGLTSEQVSAELRRIRLHWQQYDPTHSVIAQSYTELHERFRQLSYLDGLNIQKILFPSTLSSSSSFAKFNFLDFLYSFFYDNLTKQSKRHLFLSFVLKLDQPSRTTMQHHLRTYSSDYIETSTINNMKKQRFRQVLRYLYLELQKAFGEMTETSVSSSEDFHAQMLAIYQQLSPKDYEILAQKWGVQAEDVQHFRHKLDKFMQNLLQDNPHKFDVFMSRILYLNPVSLLNSWREPGRRKLKYEMEKSLIAQFHHVLNEP